MKTRTFVWACCLCVLTLCVLVPLDSDQAAADSADLTGQWYGTWHSYVLDWGANLGVFIDQSNGYVVVNAPEYWFFFQPLPALFEEDSLTIFAGDYVFSGTIAGNSIAGWVLYDGFIIAEWQISREILELPQPGPGPGPSCSDIPPLFCTGDAEHCTELVLFDPDVGPGYIDYPQFEEVWGDQCYSYLRRDFRHLVKYAVAKVECKTTDWAYWDYSPVALGNMSEDDGSTPGTSVGTPYHLTHEDGNHIDIAYYQLYAANNRLRPVGEHYEGYIDVRRCVGEPYALDPWRTALLIACLSEHPHLSYILVDERVGPVLEDALDYLETFGWIDSGVRVSIPLLYGPGLYPGHHNHLHATMRRLHPIVSEAELKPDTLNKSSRGNHITAYIELVEGYDAADIDSSTVALIVNGHTILYADPEGSEVSDYNENGVADLTVKFDRKAATEAVGTGPVEMAITGSVDDKLFQASDTVLVISR